MDGNFSSLANIDAIQVAGRFGIQKEYAVNFECDSEGTRLNYDVVSRAVSSVRANACLAEAVPACWKEEIEKDYRKRHMRKAK